MHVYTTDRTHETHGTLALHWQQVNVTALSNLLLFLSNRRDGTFTNDFSADFIWSGTASSDNQIINKVPAFYLEIARRVV